MVRIAHLTPDYAVAGAITPEDIAAFAEAGFKTLINNRPDGEERGQASANTCAEAARKAGLAYHHIPASSREDVLSDHVVDATIEAIRESTGPVLAHCRSGFRSSAIWAAAMAKSGAKSSQDVQDLVAAAGFDIGPMTSAIDTLANAAKAKNAA